MAQRVRAGVFAMLMCMPAIGCFSEVADAPNARDVALDTEAILKGSAVDTETNAKGGFVALSIIQNGVEKVFCSGTLYANAFLLTARHCFQDAPAVVALQRNPSALRVTMGRGQSDGQFRTGKTIYFPARDIDYAIVEVNIGFIMPRNSDNILDTVGYSRQMADVASGALAICFGYGVNQETCDASGNNCSGSGQGTLRFATLTAQVQKGSPVNFYQFSPNSAGQLQAHGDSGGGCIPVVRTMINLWRQPLVSINESCFPGKFCNANPATAAVQETWHVAP